MNVVHKIKMDLLHKQNTAAIDVMQCDGNARTIEFSLYSGGIVWNVPDGVSVAVAYMRPDGAKGIYDTLADGSSAVSVANNLVSAILVPQAIAVAGETKLTVVFTTANGNQLATFCVVLKVESNPAIGAVEPEDYINLRQVLVEIVEKAMAEMGATGTFRVAITESPRAADKAFAEIYAAHEAGQMVECVLENGEVLALFGVVPEAAIFQNINNRYYSRIVIKADDTVTYNSGNYALQTDLPDEDVVGGYYSPTVTDNGDGTMTVSFAASDADMPAVEPVTVTLPEGPGISGVQLSVTEYDRVIMTINFTDGNSNTISWDRGTPVRGTDYWTEEDKAEIVADVLAALPAAEGVAF